ncbi:RAMP superfamily CRISPR-associated protein [Carboxydocella sp. JDF658]|uniref:RAMP superfamily CRISPR-associated protein n=1 Tax=Carboxydocella sp. JDF658 TaxID=1926600 RepID=UPI0009ADF29C|nr:RAMP superfamily CRISPR-associated protein [Carboxydocella sp. JDF658]GAW32177.1 RAMP superfamily protein probably involved in DNA repair [Carboxydocella sp. JDF658]
MRSKSKIELELKVRNETPLLISTGSAQQGFADFTFIRLVNNRPCIPASTFKGRWRYYFSYLWNAFFPEEKCCHYLGRDGECHCPACRIFGGKGFQPSRVRLTDLVVADSYDSVIRHQVAINRYLRTSQDKALASLEAVDRDADWCGAAEIILTETEMKRELACLLAALKMMRTLGSNKSRGMGWVKIDFRLRPAIELEELWQYLKSDGDSQ